MESKDKLQERIKEVVSQFYGASLNKEDNLERYSDLGSQLNEIGQPAIDYLLYEIQNNYHHDHSPGMESPHLRIALMQMGDPAVEALIAAFRDPNSKISPFGAAKTLGRFGDESVVSPLLNIAKEKDVLITNRCYAIWALSELNDEKCIPSLIEMLQDEGDEVIIATVQALANFDDSRLILPLLGEMDHYVRGDIQWQEIKPGDNPVAHIVTYYFLDSRRRETIIPQLISAQEHKEPVIQNAAIGLLRRMGELSYSIEEKIFRDLLDAIREEMNNLFGTPNADHKSRIKIARITNNFLPFVFVDDATYKRWGDLLFSCIGTPPKQILDCLQEIHRELAPNTENS